MTIVTTVFVIMVLSTIDFHLYLITPDEFKKSLKDWEKVMIGSGIVVWLRYKQLKKK